MIESPRHDLDETIERVAAKMVAVPDDDGMLSRTMASLPERTSSPWFLAVPVQMVAGVALVLVAFVYARPSHEVPSIATLPVAERAVVTEPRPNEMSPAVPDPRSPIPGPRLRQGYGGQARLSVAAIERPDHERSLPPVAAIEAIDLGEIAAPAIELHAPASLEPLVLTDLSLDSKGDS